tara:strand:- start:5472 stop:6674 length:1203 start_codon:yes stop_codon:yes gene_type:complete
MNLSGGTGKRRNTLIFASMTHIWSDLFFVIIVPLLPLIQSDPDLLLSYTEAGLFKSVYAASSVVLQIPAGYLATKFGEFWLLIFGNVWVGIGLIGMALTSGYFLLLLLALVAGFGGGTQHPLATSLVSKIYDSNGRSTAVGFVNFAGDIGKLLAPLLSLLCVARFGWRGTLRIVGLFGLVNMVVLATIRPWIKLGGDVRNEFQDVNIDKREKTDLASFGTIGSIGFIDSGIRSAALAFLPFILKDKGLVDNQIFIMLTFLLAGGALGKFLCGWLDDRYGSMFLIWATKFITAVLLVYTLFVPSALLIPLMFVLGIGLNGTSSVLYSLVSLFITSKNRSVGYGYYYTITESGGTLAPILFGIVADIFNIRKTIMLMGLSTLVILPASLILKTKIDIQEEKS